MLVAHVVTRVVWCMDVVLAWAGGHMLLSVRGVCPCTHTRRIPQVMASTLTDNYWQNSQVMQCVSMMCGHIDILESFVLVDIL